MIDTEDRLRVPPHSLEAEQSLIGALLVDSAALLASDRLAKKARILGRVLSRVHKHRFRRLAHGRPKDGTLHLAGQTLQRGLRFRESLNCSGDAEPACHYLPRS